MCALIILLRINYLFYLKHNYYCQLISNTITGPPHRRTKKIWSPAVARHIHTGVHGVRGVVDRAAFGPVEQQQVTDVRVLWRIGPLHAVQSNYLSMQMPDSSVNVLHGTRWARTTEDDNDGDGSSGGSTSSSITVDMQVLQQRIHSDNKRNAELVCMIDIPLFSW